MATYSPPGSIVSDMTPEKPNVWMRTIVMVVIVVLIVASIVGYKWYSISKMMASFKPPPAPVVTTLPVQLQDWRNQINSVGNIRAWRGTDLSAEVAGLVRGVHFVSGQSVAAGSVLFELNADPERAQLQSFQAAAELAKTTLARDREQLSVSAVSQATIDADEADLKNKVAQVDQQRAVIEKKTIRAPFAGRTGITTINPGQYLNAGDKVVTIQSIDTIYVDFNVPQRELARVTVGSDVELAVDAWPKQTFKGKLTAISSSLDTGTRNVLVEASVKNPKHELLPGMFGKVALLVGTGERYLTAPQSSVSYNPYGSTVFVVDSGKDEKGEAKLTARQVFVTTGATRGDQVAILKGLKEGDVIVTSGQLKLKNGGPLQVDNTVKPLDDASPTPQEQ